MHLPQKMKKRKSLLTIRRSSESKRDFVLLNRVSESRIRLLNSYIWLLLILTAYSWGNEIHIQRRGLYRETMVFILFLEISHSD